MRVVLLSGAGSIHTIRWANSLAALGVDVHVITQHSPIESFSPRVTVYRFPNLGRLGYFTMVPFVKKLLVGIRPDIVHAHYASGYGTTARLVGFRPLLLSVWGSDIYLAPKKSMLHSYLIRRNLTFADLVASTSHAMAAEVKRIFPDVSDIRITPFGVDPERFHAPVFSSASHLDSIVVGTVKTLNPVYGISTLLRAFAILRTKLLAIDHRIGSRLRLRIVGGGPQLSELLQLSADLGIMDRCDFVGRVNHDEVPGELSKMDVFVALSNSESFGVAVIEASLSGVPVVVSRVGGLPEVVVEGLTGFIVTPNDPVSAAQAIEKLIVNRDLRISMGRAGRLHVLENYNWSVCVRRIMSIYNEMVDIR